MTDIGRADRHATAATLGLMAGAPPFPPERRVTLENWQDAGFNRWGFQHVRDLVPTARIESGPRASAWRLPRADRDLGALRFKHIRRSLTINSMLDETWTDGFLVLHRGAVMLEHYGNGMDPGTPHVLMSVSKSIVAAMAGILFARGSVTPETAVTALLPELAGIVLRRGHAAPPPGYACRYPVRRGLHEHPRRCACVRADLPDASPGRTHVCPPTRVRTSQPWVTMVRTAARSATGRS